VTAAALCGTDLHLVEGKMPGFEEGVVLGHEFVGVVEEAYRLFAAREATKIVLKP